MCACVRCICKRKEPVTGSLWVETARPRGFAPGLRKCSLPEGKCLQLCDILFSKRGQVCTRHSALAAQHRQGVALSCPSHIFRLQTLLGNTHVHTHTRTHTHMYTYTHTYICMQRDTHAHTCTQRDPHTHMHTYTHAGTYIPRDTRTQTHTHRLLHGV